MLIRYIMTLFPPEKFYIRPAFRVSGAPESQNMFIPLIHMHDFPAYRAIRLVLPFRSCHVDCELFPAYKTKIALFPGMDSPVLIANIFPAIWTPDVIERTMFYFFCHNW
jgi:hypothetical protein